MKKLAIVAAVLAAVGYVFRGECKGACASLCKKNTDRDHTAPETAIPTNTNAPV